MSDEGETLLSRLPHQPPMRLINEVVAVGRGSAVCRATVGRELCQLFGDGQSMDSYAGIEIIAQAAAIAAGGEDQGTARSGMLIQVGRFSSTLARIPCGSILTSEVSVDVGMDGSVGSVKGELHLEGSPVCSAKLTLAIDRS